MEQSVERIAVHEGIQLFKESIWTLTEHTGLQVFLLIGVRDKEILTVFQTSQAALVQDIDNFNIYFPFNSKIIGVYIQYQLRDTTTFSNIIEIVFSQGLQQRILPLNNFMVILREQKSTQEILESIECSFMQQGSPFDNRKIFRADFDHADLKREQLLNNFFYVNLRCQFEGFDDELVQTQQELLDNIENPMNLVLLFKQLNMIQNYQSMGEEFGKRLNIEVKKLIKANKEKQMFYNLLNMEFMLIPKADDESKCASYNLEHTSDKDLRKMDINIAGIFTTSDNLHDQLDLFIKHAKRLLISSFFPYLKSRNLCHYSYNLRESALLVNTLYQFGRSHFHDSMKLTDYQDQRQKFIYRYCFDQASPRLRVKSSVQYIKEQGFDRPVDIHAPLMKKNNFDQVASQKYVVQGSYMYYHYMQDNFNDNGWGCAYRSLQTLLSYFKCEGYAPNFEVPTHKEIQQALVDMGDKEKDIIGSNHWIGAFEVNLCIQQFLQIDCKIMNLTSGAELITKGRELRDHFIHQGTPIMIGGDLYAHTILGIDYCEELDDVKFLILDPHYLGNDGNFKNILQKGWCGWKDITMFKADAFYNLCMPIKPHDV